MRDRSGEQLQRPTSTSRRFPCKASGHQIINEARTLRAAENQNRASGSGRRAHRRQASSIAQAVPSSSIYVSNANSFDPLLRKPKVIHRLDERAIDSPNQGTHSAPKSKSGNAKREATNNSGPEAKPPTPKTAIGFISRKIFQRPRKMRSAKSPAFSIESRVRLSDASFPTWHTREEEILRAERSSLQDRPSHPTK